METSGQILLAFGIHRVKVYTGFRANHVALTMDTMGEQVCGCCRSAFSDIATDHTDSFEFTVDVEANMALVTWTADNQLVVMNA